MEFGVDEAGKGPVLGSMFVAAVRADPEQLPADVGDSKDIEAQRRQELDTAIREVATAEIVEIPVERIDDPDTDMNSLTVAGHGEALTGVVEDGLSGYADAGDTNAVRFERRVASELDCSVDLRAEHGADEQYPIVGAASILAKVAREAHVDKLATEYGAVGSGYPSDPTTREFLESFVREHGELPDCARASWQTSQDALQALDQASLSDF
ncbi:ribonuclease HII [Halovenus sp. HT40]|uniref:ribonuclease HII n=1 Tax=Halovenus sp. HT40 TaxID=3126691 RepID=UPI00300ED9D3